MNRQIKILLVIFIACFVAVIVNLTWLQVFGANKIRDNAYNKRRLVEEYAIQRGDIISADGQVLAKSVDTGTEYKYQREYPFGKTFGSVTGYDSWQFGRSGLEKSYNKDLLGEGSSQSFRGFANKLLGASQKGDSIVTTVDSRLQQTSAEALGDRKGSVVALDPKTGAVLSMVTSPTFDPNAMVPMKGGDATAAGEALTHDPEHPLFDRSTLGLYPPGSSFKVVTASAALDMGVVTPDTPFDCTGKLVVDGFPIYDFNRTSHGNLTFDQALVESCNITFAQVGLRLGASALVRYSELYGFNRVVPFDLPVAKSHVQDAASMDKVQLASSAFGQGQDLATPLQMALVAAGVANGGTVMRPRLVTGVQDYNGKVIQQFEQESYQQVIDTDTARTLTRMMVEVVESGTGTAAQIDGVAVAGKTGTAEVEGQEPEAWFICFAPAFQPKVAVAVLVENGGEGGVVAAPIARKVLSKALSL